MAYGELPRFEKVLSSPQIEAVSSSSITPLVSSSAADVQCQLLAICAEILKLEPADLDIDVPFSDYGVDSILMMALMKEIEVVFAKPISPSAIIDFPTIEKLADYLITEGIVQSAINQSSQASSQLLETSATQAWARPRIKNTSRFKIAPIQPASRKIAVIGMAGRFPESPNLEVFWAHLKAGDSLITEVSPERWRLVDYYDSQKTKPGKSYSKWGGFLENIDYFDAAFFGIKAEEAVLMDPLQRLLLELSQELLDHAGYPKEELSGSQTGVFIGGGESDYVQYAQTEKKAQWHKHSIVNRIQNMQAARINDFYNFKGPALTIDTACSSALVAVHQACQSLLHHECTLAIAGGAEILIGPDAHIGFSQAEVLSDEGVSYVFDERAKGFVLGEGVGLVLLKPYDQALQDGDNILGVILASAINNDGHTIGLTVPNLEGQKTGYSNRA